VQPASSLNTLLPRAHSGCYWKADSSWKLSHSTAEDAMVNSLWRRTAEAGNLVDVLDDRSVRQGVIQVGLVPGGANVVHDPHTVPFVCSRLLKDGTDGINDVLIFVGKIVLVVGWKLDHGNRIDLYVRQGERFGWVWSEPNSVPEMLLLSKILLHPAPGHRKSAS
jgi:hypothetical protein